jgi:starch phosphorylase
MHPRQPRVFPRPTPLPLDTEGMLQGFARRMTYTVAKNEYTASDFDVYRALAHAVGDRLTERWFATQDAYYRRDVKRAYYLSLEFLTGRALYNNVVNLGVEPAVREALACVGFDLDELREPEWDAGLGNGGLGRLAACLLDSAATLGLPFYGYGIRYEYGIFRQHIKDGQQVEAPDNWLRYGNPWEIPRPAVLVPVSFYGRSEHYRDEHGRFRVRWVDTRRVWAMAYDTPVIGYRCDTVNSLRLWAAKASREFDLQSFNAGEYVRAVEERNESENISKVLYPPDDRYAGKELRLKQQYFFVSATLQDVVRRFKKRGRRDLDELPDKVAVQLNDTHPALAVPELMRVLIDHEQVEWERAWAITQRVCAYTNHTVLPEALETWPAELLGRLLPRHLEIIEEIDRRLRTQVALASPADPGEVERLAIVSEGRVRMAHLAITGSHSVNGVARLHTEILKRSTFPGFHRLFPGRFNAKTNGVTPRRWLLQCNPRLAALVTEVVGDGWPRELERLAELRRCADDAAFRARWAAVKRANKENLARCLRERSGLELDPEALLDCHVKRLHEYKRQFLAALHATALYLRLRDGAAPEAPRTVLFAGKAAPSYFMAKLVIRLIHALGERVAAEPACAGRLNVLFVPNYSVSVAERVFPACELSEQISTAGTEASGTGNMKAALNGALTIGTLDGATIEMADAVGADNMFIFGHTADEVAELRRSGYDPRRFLAADPELQRALDFIASGALRPSEPDLFRPLVAGLLEGDRYFHCADFGAYREAQRRAEQVWRDPAEWNRRSILNVAGMGRFSSDRTTREYAAEIWGLEPVPVSFEAWVREGAPPT